MAADTVDWSEKQLSRIYLTSVGHLLFDLWNVEGETGLEMLRQMGYPVASAHINVVPHIDIAGIRLTELAKRTHLTKQSVWEALKGMEAHGYIVRTKDPRDARAVLISWTPKGIEFLRIVCRGITIREDDLTRRIGRKYVKTLKAILARMRNSYVREPPLAAQLVAALRAQSKKKRTGAGYAAPVRRSS